MVLDGTQFTGKSPMTKKSVISLSLPCPHYFFPMTFSTLREGRAPFLAPLAESPDLISGVTVSKLRNLT